MKEQLILKGVRYKRDENPNEVQDIINQGLIDIGFEIPFKFDMDDVRGFWVENK